MADPRTWGAFADALALWGAGKAAGVGFVLTDADPFGGVDLDGCRDPETGDLASWATDLIAVLDTYTEVSPSGTGVHALALGKPNKGGPCRAGGIEVYGRDRYLTVTGAHLSGTPTGIADRGRALRQLQGELQNRKESAQAPRQLRPLVVSDDAIIRRAFAAASGTKFARLWAGDRSGYDTPSEADLALCVMLIFWCKGDMGRADGLFRQSGLMRPKWDSHRGQGTYGSKTLSKALSRLACCPTYQARCSSLPETGVSQAQPPGSLLKEVPPNLCVLLSHLARSDEKATRSRIRCNARQLAEHQTDWPTLVTRCGCPPTAVVAAIGRELMRRGGGQFFMSSAVAGRLVGGGPTWGWELLRRLLARGVFVLVSPNTRYKAAEYRFCEAVSLDRGSTSQELPPGGETEVLIREV